MSETDLISVKELAQQLDVSDALLKKFVRDFGIDAERIKKRIHLKDESVNILKDIVRLRASGKKNKEIKEIFDQVQKAKVKEEKAEKETKPVKAKVAGKRGRPKKEKKEVETKTEVEAKTETKVEAKTEKKVEAKTERKVEAETEKKVEAKTERKVEAEVETKTEEPAEDKRHKREKTHKKKYGDKKSKKEKPEEDYSEYLAEQMGEKHQVQDEIALARQEVPEEESELTDEDLEAELAGEEPVEETEEVADWDGKPMQARRVRHRAFNFRYVQRQIANDSRRVDYIKYKLERSNLSTPERLKLEEVLDNRYKILSGWVHLLRWVKSKSYN